MARAVIVAVILLVAGAAMWTLRKNKSAETVRRGFKPWYPEK